METTRERREREIGDLAERVRVRQFEPGHYQIGALHLWPATGRWHNEMTGHRGRMGNLSVGDLVRREHLLVVEENARYLDEIRAYMREHRAHLRRHRKRQAHVREMLDDGALWDFIAEGTETGDTAASS